ncbi:blp-like protein [Halorubrum aidingense JCM 13560]|uniref:Blp-like protein n=1 Tax=Halorubrum aidingense JCM 13560 TaxID=1230454 RepID=M0PID4_9EURY|nr:SRPBCC family protein [Halorubrum aidingense]EMA69683.1 blp-like protein [Halorubrum aidingense JCM 13560]
MFDARDTVQIDADADAVFEFLDDPHNHAAVTPGLTDVRDVERLPNGGKRLSYTYRMAGAGIDGELVQTVHEPNERMRFELRGRLSGTIELSVTPANGGAELTYAAEYDLSESALTAIGAPVIRRFNERQLRRTLDNVAAQFASNGG